MDVREHGMVVLMRGDGEGGYVEEGWEVVNERREGHYAMMERRVFGVVEDVEHRV